MSLRRRRPFGLGIGLVVFACVVALLDSSLISVLPPLLPAYVRQFGIGSGLAGVLSASYSVGLLFGALPAGLLIARIGQRAVVALALLVLAVSSVVFGFAGSFEAVVAARTVEGVASAFAWTATLAWLASVSLPVQRARLFGLVFGTAFAGFTLGPVLGAIAARVGTDVVFSVFALVAACAAVLAFTFVAAGRPQQRPLAAYRSLVVQPGIPYALWLQAMPGFLAGSIGVVAALRLSGLGASTSTIAAVFLVGGAVQAAVSPLAGGWTDRVGPLRPIRGGFLAAALLIAATGLLERLVLLGASVALALGATAWVLTPATAALTTGVERAGEDSSLGFALMNLAFAPGAILGAVLAGVLRDTAGDGTALGVVALVCVGTALVPARLALPVEHAKQLSAVESGSQP